MKILQIIPSLKIGGAETMMCNLSCELAKQNHEVVVVAFYETETFLNEKLKKSGVKVIGIDKKSGFNFKTLKIIKNIIKIEKPDVIHTHLYVLPYVWLVSGKTKIVHTLHSIAPKEQSGIGKKICQFIYKHSKKCTAVAISKMVKKSFDDEYNYNFKMPIIENGIDFDNILKKENYKFNDSINIFHVGSLIPVKNHELMINSLKELTNKYKNLKLNFYGGGYLLEELKNIVSEGNLTDNIAFEGVKSNINEILKEGDIFILPSQHEGLPLSLLEAMAAGLPCIAANVGGIPDVIEDNVDGVLIQPNEKELIEALEKIILDEKFRKKIGKNAILKSKMFSNTIVTGKYIEVYSNE